MTRSEFCASFSFLYLRFRVNYQINYAINYLKKKRPSAFFVFFRNAGDEHLAFFGELQRRYEAFLKWRYVKH